MIWWRNSARVRLDSNPDMRWEKNENREMIKNEFKYHNYNVISKN